jgi:pilus assembly protein CpaB
VGRRIVLLIAAAAIAAVGTALVYTYAKNADDRAMADQSPVTVVVAKTEIPAGTPVRQAAESGAFEQRDIPSATAIDGAMSSVEPIEEQVALTTLFPNQQLSTQMFGKTLAESSVLPIPPDNIAVSFQFTDPARVAGFVKPGSEVVVFLTIGPGNGSQNQQDETTRVLLPKALVIGVGPTTAAPQSDTSKNDEENANTEQIPRALLTLALTDTQATKLVYGSQHGTLYLGLLNAQSKVSGELPPVTGQNLFG